MADTFVQLPADSTGKKLRTRDRVVGANTVHEQAIYQAANPTYYFQTAFAAGAQNKIFLDIFNASGSGLVVKIRKLFVASTVATVTGVGFQFDFDRTSAVGTGGTALTAVKADTADANLHANITARHAATAGATKSGGSLFSTYLSSEETHAGAHFNWAFSLVPEGVEVKEPTAREGEGLRLIQITNSTAGTWGVTAVVTTETA